jgi:hypothetical protein
MNVALLTMVALAAAGASARPGLTAAGRWEPRTGWVQQPPTRYIVNGWFAAVSRRFWTER